MAHSEARALTFHSPETDRLWWLESKDRLVSYSEIIKAYQLAQRVMPPPHQRLSREVAVLLRQLQVGSILAPATLHVLHSGLH